jgi:hypothetical protein
MAMEMLDARMEGRSTLVLTAIQYDQQAEDIHDLVDTQHDALI